MRLGPGLFKVCPRCLTKPKLFNKRPSFQKDISLINSERQDGHFIFLRSGAEILRQQNGDASADADVSRRRRRRQLD